jgi:transcriptional regulator with AAA-type ATPase domain
MDVTSEITPEDLGLVLQEGLETLPGSFTEKLDPFGRRLINDALKRAGGNQAQAARHLKLSYHQFRYYLKKYTGPAGECRRTKGVADKK